MFKRFWPCLLIIPPVTLVVCVLIAAVITYITPTAYESQATVHIIDKPNGPGLLTNDNVISQASKNLDAPARWGVDTQTASRIIRESITIDAVRGTDLLNIRARHRNREDAHDIAAAIPLAYKTLQSETLAAANLARIEQLNQAIAAQQDIVTTLRSEVMQQGASSPHPATDPESELEIRHQQETDVLMQLKVDAAKLATSSPIPHQEIIIVLEEPKLDDGPVAPDVPRNLTLGTICGLLLGLPLALAIMATLHRLRPLAKTTNPNPA